VFTYEVEKIIATNRVAKVVKGGRNFSFNAIVVVGDKNGNVGVGNGKANEIVDAIRKAKEKATKSIFSVPIVKGTIPHEILGRFGASKILLKPACAGTGIIAGGPARAILEAAGIENILSKSLGSNTKGNVVKATVDGLKNLMTIGQAAAFRGKTINELTGAVYRKQEVVEEEPMDIESVPEEVFTKQSAIEEKMIVTKGKHKTEVNEESDKSLDVDDSVQDKELTDEKD